MASTTTCTNKPTASEVRAPCSRAAQGIAAQPVGAQGVTGAGGDEYGLSNLDALVGGVKPTGRSYPPR